MNVEEHEIDKYILLRHSKSKAYLSVNSVLRCLIDGVFDEKSVFFKLNGTLHILHHIWNFVKMYWKSYIEIGDGDCTDAILDPQSSGIFGDIYYMEYYIQYRVSFPEPADIHVNMMPFIIERSFEKCLLPEYLRPYWNIIDKAIGIAQPTTPYDNTVCYLTIHESEVTEGDSQRRGGIHTGSPGKIRVVKDDDKEDGKYIYLGRVNYDSDDIHKERGIEEVRPSIGGGVKKVEFLNRGGMAAYSSLQNCTETILFDGIYMASNVRSSGKIWNCKVHSDENGDEIIGNLGDIEHLREVLPVGYIMEANRIYWLTDRTPLESLPLQVGTYRQIFRLVTSEVSVWFEDDSTKNPLGVEPDPDTTIIIKGSKFCV